MDENNNNKDNRNLDEKDKTGRMERFRTYGAKIMDKDGFYVILFVCICIVAISSVWVSRNNIDNYNTLNNEQNKELVEGPTLDEMVTKIQEDVQKNTPDIRVVDIEDNETTEEAATVSAPKTDEEVSKEPEATEEKSTVAKNTKDAEKKVTEEETSTSKEEQKKKEIPVSSTVTSENTEAEATELVVKSMGLPMQGSVSMNYASDQLVYSKTLEQWTTHHGLDIRAEQGTAIRAALDGVVKEITEDEALGIMITLEHANGLLTKYACLSTDEMVELGQEVQKGDIISGVGKASGFELAQGPHLHFEVIHNGEHMDPKEFLPKFRQ